MLWTKVLYRYKRIFLQDYFIQYTGEKHLLKSIRQHNTDLRFERSSDQLSSSHFIHNHLHNRLTSLIHISNFSSVLLLLFFCGVCVVKIKRKRMSPPTGYWLAIVCLHIYHTSIIHSPLYRFMLRNNHFVKFLPIFFFIGNSFSFFQILLIRNLL